MSVHKQQSVFCTILFILRVIKQNMTTTTAATIHNNQEIVISGLMLPVLSVLTI